MNENMSPADVAAVVGNTDRNFGYPYPVYGGGFGNSGFGGDGSWIWFILILALFGGWGGNGNGFGGFNGFNNEYAWLSNGQKEIMQNTNNGFDTLHLSNQIEGVRDGIYGLSNQLCNCCADMNSTVSNGFYNAEISANNRQMANMQQGFGISSQLADVKATILAENCADRAALADGLKDVLINQTANTQKIIDEIFRDRLDEKDDKIAELNRQLQLADLKASQIAQTQAITSNIYNELKNCPVGTVPVFGNQPIFTCPNNNSCGCGNTFGSTLV